MSDPEESRTPPTLDLHATAVAVETQFGPLAVLLRGPSGSGKSALALRLIDEGGSLVGDDRIQLQRRGKLLHLRPPERLSGLLEVRGFGIVEVPCIEDAPLGLIVDLAPGQSDNRLPDEQGESLLETEVPRLALDPATPSAGAFIRMALRSRARSLSDLLQGAVSASQSDRQQDGPPELLLITGLSGAGRTLGLKVLEDIGYEAIDNLPLGLIDGIVGANAQRQPLAVGIDSRTLDFSVELFLEQIDRLERNRELAFSLLFFECDDQVLQQRFTETRRRHPLALNRPLAEGIAAERSLLMPLRARADQVIDTSDLAPPELHRLLSARFASRADARMQVFVTSFSYRFGLPREADLVFDMRFLENPHYQEDLRPLTGQDSAVQAFVTADPAFQLFFDHLTALLDSLLEGYEANGKSYLTLAFGCTGGRHRSVAAAEEVFRWLDKGKHPLHLSHRELERGRQPARGRRKS
ncbi:RNase adapter RapZ [Fodinicurvata fenggangensis]|uniref:RNase adapter RapZ n=1 Tax=Fodinicurvata fenggangensis TaxID=1121830 RepID=UPI0009DCE4F4|nr:RNase adapter RapZ [Fodinicurvata fenggangensis]